MDYNIKPMIHRFQQNGMNIVMDVNSGIVHVVDDVTYKVLAYYNGTNRDMVLANLIWMISSRSRYCLHRWILTIRWPSKTVLSLKPCALILPMTATFAVNTALQGKVAMGNGVCS